MTEGRRIAEKALASFPTCPIPEIKRLGTILKRWRDAFLAYFDSPHRVARGSRNRDHYRLRMLLTGGGLTRPHLR